MITIIFCVDNLGIGGLERQLIELLKALPSDKYYSVITTLHLNRGWDTTFSGLADEIIHLKRNSKLSLAPFFQYHEILKKYGKKTILHSFSILCVFYMLPAKLLFKRKMINGSIRHAGITKGFDHFLSHFSLLLSDFVISNSLAGLKYYGIKNNYSVIYNIIHLSRFIKSDRQQNNIIMVATFSLYKDQNTFLKVAKRLISENKISKAILVGGGPTLKYYRKLVKNWDERDKIEFLGSVNKGVEQLLSNCSIGVLCSTRKYSEGISNSILEYMGAGILAIASDVGGTSEIITHRYNGLLFDVENSGSLYNEVIWALEHPVEVNKIITAAYSVLRSKFSATTNLKQQDKIYSSLL
jgi:glycosyltransferase involved in cell wall biosynthesis